MDDEELFTKTEYGYEVHNQKNIKAHTSANSDRIFIEESNGVITTKGGKDEITIRDGVFIEITDYDEKDKASLFEGGYDALIFDLRKEDRQLEHFIFKGDTYIQVFDTKDEKIISAIKLESVELASFKFHAYQTSENSKESNGGVFIPKEIESIELYDKDKPYTANQAKKIDELIVRGKAKKSIKNLDIGFNKKDELDILPPSIVKYSKDKVDNITR